MSFYLLYDVISLLVQAVINVMCMHGVAPIDAQNIAATYLNLLTQAARAAAMA